MVQSTDAVKPGRPRKQTQREWVLCCVVKLVGRHGFERVRLRDVANEAAVSIGSLQHYFDTRDGLMSAAFQYQGERVIREIERAAASGAHPWDRIRALIDHATAKPGFDERSRVWLEFAAASSRNPHLREVMERVYEGWRLPLRQAIDEGTAGGTFAPVMPPADVVDTILTVIDGFELATAGGIQGFDGGRARDVVIRTIAALLRMGG